MSLINPERSLRALRKTPVLLNALIQPLTQEQALSVTDGPGGWNVVEIMCHLRDFEAIFMGRVERALREDNPRFEPVDHEALVITNRYREQDVHGAFADYLSKRRAFVALLEGLTDEQWARRGIHPQMGDCTVLEQAANTALHDVTHLEQMVRTLGQSGALL